MRDIVINAFLQAYHRELSIRSRFQQVFKEKKCQSSMSQKGNPYDNTLMEPFCKTLKRELVNDANFTSIEQAQLEIFKYIETYCNTKRIYIQL